jgi:hypothetical protein
VEEVGATEGVRRCCSVSLLVVVVGAPAAASWHGLTAAGEHALGLHGVQSWLVPLVLDAAAAYSAVLALRDTERGDAAGLDRLLVWAYVAGSAALNAWWADRTGGLAAALFFAVASVSAAVLWDRTLRQVRRDVLRNQGAVSSPTPRFRLARWVVAPSETAAAWRHAVIEDVSNPTDAVRAVRGLPAPPVPLALDPAPVTGDPDLDFTTDTDVDPWVKSALDAERAQMDAAFDFNTGLDDIYTRAGRTRPLSEFPNAVVEQLASPPALVVTTKAAVVRTVLAELGTNDPRAVAVEVGDRGVTVDVAYVRDVIRRDKASAQKRAAESNVKPLRFDAS